MPPVALRSVAGPIGAALLVGFVLPLSWGLWLPLAVVLAAVVITRRRALAVASVVTPAGGWPELVRTLPPRDRIILLVLAILPCVAFATVGARAIGALVVAYPAAIWGLAAALVGGALVGRLAGRGRAPAALLVAAAAVAAGVAGERYEAAGVDARGYAHSGPILGIHPLQTTAVVVDGYGPFDLPINDYVEPDGHRGYGPETLAAAIERALHRIADVHFADGPARARQAFADARAAAVYTAPVLESLDSQPTDAEQPRFVVYSGTHGQRSRVEFVCPGARNDPRGRQPDNVMNRMCPDKYASEASAGLGVTGRWTGYAEARGNERVGISRAMGWTRSDDGQGRDVIEREHRWWAWGVLALVVPLCAARRRATADGVQSVAATLAVAGLIALTGLALAWSSPITVGLSERAPTWTDSASLIPWLPALLLLGGFVQLSAPVAAGITAWSVRLRALLVLVATLAVAASLSALEWTRPELWATRDDLALERLVAGLADRIARHGELDVLTVEAGVASAAAVMLLAMLVWLPDTLAHLWRADETRDDPDLGRRLARIALLVVPAACLVLSRKTQGAAALVPGAVASWIVLGSALHVIVRRTQARAVVRVLPHAAWVALALAVMFESLRGEPGPSGFLLICVLAGVGAAVASLSLLLGPGARVETGTE